MKEKKTKTASDDENVLAMYLNEITRIPLLTREEEDQAARAAKKGNIDARNKLVNGNLRFVVNVAKKYQGHGIPLADLISEGNIGLMQAVEKYDVDRGCHFISYAVYWIRQAILKALCEKSRLIRLPANRAGDLFQIEKAKKMITEQSNNETEIQEIAELLNMEEDYVKEMMAVSMDVVSLEKQVNIGKGISFLGDFIEDNRYDAPEQEVIRKALEFDINELLETLGSKEAEVIRYRYGLGLQEPLSLKEIGERYDLSKERIRQIEQKALACLQHSSRKTELRTYVA